jgi:hypothetical protein
MAGIRSIIVYIAGFLVGIGAYFLFIIISPQISFLADLDAFSYIMFALAIVIAVIAAVLIKLYLESIN